MVHHFILFHTHYYIQYITNYVNTVQDITVVHYFIITYILKTLLNAHKNHHLPSFVAFVDLGKAYDTANHDLLLRVLKKYGAPPKLVCAIKTMYTDLKVVLKIEK